MTSSFVQLHGALGALRAGSVELRLRLGRLTTTPIVGRSAARAEPQLVHGCSATADLLASLATIHHETTLMLTVLSVADV